tara:strand:+ start:2486 stop:3589 length:1104 start_codon:yes stop_codon:yes gene_type:complete
MAYIGNPPISGNFQVCDAISVVNGQAAYTMQVSSANVSPESANHMLVSLNGVLQKPGSSFTISGSTITFASNLATGDVIDFILLLGNVNDIGTPSDATVTDAKTNFVSTSSAAGLQIKGDGTTDGTLQLNCSQNSHGIKLRSPAHSNGQSYTLTFPTGNVTADRFLKVASVSGSGTTGIGQLSFAEAGGGGLIHIKTQTASDTSQIDFINGTSDVVFDGTYNKYCFMIDIHPASDNVTPQMLYRQATNSTFLTTNYAYCGQGIEAGSAEVTRQNATDSQIELTTSSIGGADDETMAITLFVSMPSRTDTHCLSYWNGAFMDHSSDLNSVNMSGTNHGTVNAIDGIRFKFSSGNISYGTISLFGVANS